MSTWFPRSGGPTSAEYALAEVRSFNTAVVRAYHAMQRTQACAQIVLPLNILGWNVSLRQSVWCCRVADNTPPRLACEDREMTMRLASPHLMGVDASVHGGAWFTRQLIWSFVAGLERCEVPDDKFVCKCALGLPCPGRKANEVHQMMRDLKKEEKKEKRTYVAYEPSDSDLAND